MNNYQLTINNFMNSNSPAELVSASPFRIKKTLIPLGQGDKHSNRHAELVSASPLCIKMIPKQYDKHPFNHPSMHPSNHSRHGGQAFIYTGFISSLCASVSLCLVLLFFLAPQTQAQHVDSLVSEALRNNPQLQALQTKIKSAEYKSETVGYLPPPTLGIEFSQVPFNDADPLKNALSQSISLSQMFMPGGKLDAMNKAERKNISIAEKDFEAYRLKLISDVKSKYYEIWISEHHEDLRSEAIELLQSLLQSTEQLYTIGKAKYSDVLMIKAELATNKTQVEVINNQFSAAVYEMNALLGREIDNNELTIFHELEIDSLRYSDEELIEILIESNPQLQRMDEMIDMNRLEIIASNKELIPDFMLQGMVMRMPRGMILTSKTPVHMLDGKGETEYMYSIMASVTLPFAPWSSGKYSAREEELTAAISGLSSEKYDMQRRMVSELKGMLKKIQIARMQISLYSNEIIPLYKQTFEAQLSEFQNTRTSINDLINTLQMLLMREEEMAEFQMENQMIISEIEAIVGWKMVDG